MTYNLPDRKNSIIVFDLETIPETSLAKELCEISDNEISNMSLNELREEMRQYHIEKHNNEFLRQPFHRIVCISFLKIDILDELDEFGKKQFFIKELNSYSSFNCSEEEVVKKFWHLLKENKPQIVSFNGKMFDINVLKCKALKYNIDCGWYFNLGGKFECYDYPYSNSHYDLLYKYGSYTLHEMCISLNIPCKLGVDGSRVADYFDEKKYKEIREYCETDVLATFLVFLRMMIVEGEISKKEYNSCITQLENLLINQQKDKQGIKEFLQEWHRLNPNGITIK